MHHHGKRHTHKRGLLAQLGHKKIGLSFIFAGLLMASLGTLLFWQHVDALTSKGWTFVGIASQYKTPANNSPRTDKDERVIVNVYACKQEVVAGDAKTSRYTIKAYASLVHNSISANYEYPRLEILSKQGSLKRYSAGEPVSQPISRVTDITAPFTNASFSNQAVIQYGFNNYYANPTSGEATYAFSTVQNLLNCQ